jgi:NAD(P)-dependent dehydrogenase (short-subunit alcohol dehydrogenase family)
MNQVEAMAHTSDHSDASFDFADRVAVVTGGTGLIGGAVAHGLLTSGARTAVISRRADAVQAMAVDLDTPGNIIGVVADVLDQASLDRARESVEKKWGRIDILVNAAGGNHPDATVTLDGTFFDLDPEAVRRVVDLNLMGTLLPISVFGAVMANAGHGAIINISSVSATRPLSRTIGYGAAKAGIDNVTRWLADHVARRFGPGVRVNAIAPGFLISDQNRAMLLEPDGRFTDRGRLIVEMTPMARYAEAQDMVGPVLWLASDASRFVTGAVVPVDGGFTAMSGL